MWFGLLMFPDFWTLQDQTFTTRYRLLLPVCSTYQPVAWHPRQRRSRISVGLLRIHSLCLFSLLFPIDRHLIFPSTATADKRSTGTSSQHQAREGFLRVCHRISTSLLGSTAIPFQSTHSPSVCRGPLYLTPTQKGDRPSQAPHH